MAGDGIKAYVGDKDDSTPSSDLRAVYGDQDGTHINAGYGNDTLRGGNYDDIFSGGAGDDEMFGGAGADQFRFRGTNDRDGIDGASDTDYIRDLKFGEGDTLVFNDFAAGTFHDAAGVNAYGPAGSDNGSGAIISSYQGLINADVASDLISISRASPYNDNLLVSIDNGNGQIENIVITGGYSQYLAALESVAV